MLFQESQFQPVLKTLFSKFSGGAFPQTPLEWSLKSFSRRCAAPTFLARNLTLNYYNELANMYCNLFSTILYIISDNSLITLMKSGMTAKYWFVKIYLNLLPHLCCVSSMFSVQATLVLKKNIKFFFRSVVNFPDNYQRYCAQFPL